jgi:hypothetical protein
MLSSAVLGLLQCMFTLDKYTGVHHLTNDHI